MGTHVREQENFAPIRSQSEIYGEMNDRIADLKRFASLLGLFTRTRINRSNNMAEPVKAGYWKLFISLDDFYDAEFLSDHILELTTELESLMGHTLAPDDTFHGNRT